MTTLEQLRVKREEILRIAQSHGAFDVRDFGSVALGEDRPDSDVDLVVKAQENTSPWFPTGLIEELERALGRRVDVVTEDGLYWLIRRRVLREAVPLHDYEGVDIRRIWSVVESETRRVAEAIRVLLPPLQDLEAELAGPD